MGTKDANQVGYGKKIVSSIGKGIKSGWSHMTGKEKKDKKAARDRAERSNKAKERSSKAAEKAAKERNDKTKQKRTKRLLSEERMRTPRLLKQTARVWRKPNCS